MTPRPAKRKQVKSVKATVSAKPRSPSRTKPVAMTTKPKSKLKKKTKPKAVRITPEIIEMLKARAIGHPGDPPFDGVAFLRTLR